MKIVLISSYPPSKDGIADYTARLADSMKKLGNTVYIITPKNIDYKPSKNVYATLGRQAKDRKMTMAIIDKVQPDVIHMQYCISLYGLSAFSLLRLMKNVQVKAPKIKRIVTLHEVQREEEKLKLVAKVFYKFFTQFFDAFIVHIDSSKDLLVSQYNLPTKKVISIPHPVIESYKEVAKEDLDSLNKVYKIIDNFVVLCFGFIQIDKGIDQLVRSLNYFNRDQDLKLKMRVVVAGGVRRRTGPFVWFERKDRRYLNKIKTYISKHGLEDRVVFTGYVKDTQVNTWFKRADLIVLPYTSIEQSGVFNIALSANKPIIASNVGGLGETLSHAGILVPPRKPKAIAEAISRVAHHKIDVSSLLQEYKLITKHRSQEQVSKQTLSFYQTVMEAK